MCRIILLLWVCLGTNSILYGQIKDLTAFDSAKSRLEDYLVQADDQMSRSGLLVRRSRTSFNKRDEELSVTEVYAVQLRDFRRKLGYASNQTTSFDSVYPTRSESFWLDGKLKCKNYLVNSESGNGTSVDVEQDLTKSDHVSRVRANMFGPLVDHFEIDPYGLPLNTNSITTGRLTRIDNAVRFWVTKSKFIQEKTHGEFQVSTWEVQPKGFLCEITFDNKCGGMPVLLRHFSVDARNRPTKEYLAETRTRWKKVSEDEDRWIPVSASINSTNQSFDINCTFEFEFISTDKLERVISSVDWERLFNDNKSYWFQTISSVLLPSEKGSPFGAKMELDIEKRRMNK
jgi:hypothetical protein